MRVSLLIVLLFTIIYNSPGQLPGFNDHSTACDADFIAITDTVNPMTIHFQDLSSGQITLWQWSFGDGSSTTIQNPDHTYAAGGTYFVCLTVSNSDSGFICHDVKCVAITIHEPGTCVADYTYSIDPVNHLKTYFFDQSTGNINRWHWNFGDGNFSDERNPSHVFSTIGKFEVCLLAYNIDSVSICSDIKCDSVEIVPAAACHAEFTSMLDTLNPVPNTFIFKNVSTGDPNQYQWTIDDGSTYYSQDVTHHFQTSGEHEVCLIISREVQGTIVCTDSFCLIVSTAKYVDLGGHLFIGAFPINNPVSTGDTGVAYLFRKDGSKLVPFDTNSFTQYGYYAFPKVLNGSYIVKAMLTPGSQHYSKFFPAYYQEALSWKEADILDLSENNTYDSDIHLAPTTDTLMGPGIIKGTVIKAGTKKVFEEISMAEVILYDSQLKPVLFSVSGNEGQFGFTNLPYGAYYLYVEYPGKYSRLTAIWLDPVTTLIDSLFLEVFDHDVTAVPDIPNLSFVTGILFPNPATDEVSLTIELKKAASMYFEIRTMAGIIAWSGSYDCQTGSNLVTIPVRSIRKGLYLFTIKEKDGSQIAIKKLLRY